ncbi:MAG: hypothetical protein DRJ41_02170 [Thermoprotei archaeon]|nr:MAG: hypothetical protein DRJ41_02170 [Thermoprotei archaeon]
MEGLSEVERLIAIAEYKAESSAIKDFIRDMLGEYKPSSLREVRKRLSRELKDMSSGDFIVRLREEVH